MKVTGYAFPWDAIDDDAAPRRAADLGVDNVALAATYHATRVVTPLHPSRRVLDVAHSAAYFPIRPESWDHRRLAPRAPEPAYADSFNEAARRFEAVGLPVVAWVVVAHEDDLGRANSDVAVRNAFDEPYPYALCPSNQEFRSYCGQLVEEIMVTTPARGVVLEACGAVGVDHGGLHDKSDMAALSEAERWLLSICFCQSCHEGLRSADLDPSELAAIIRRALSQPVASMDAVLGEDLSWRLASFREGLSSSLRRELTQRVRSVRPEATVALHASSSPWATGSFPALGDAAHLAEVSTVVANCWNETTAEHELSQMKEILGTRSNLGGYVRADRVAGDPTETVERYQRLGLDELHLYHLGLFNHSSLEVAQELIVACHAAEDV